LSINSNDVFGLGFEEMNSLSAILKGNIVIPPSFEVDGEELEWIPWDEV